MKYKDKNSISKYLFFLLFISSIAAFLVGRQHEYDLFSLWCVLFNAIMLFVTFNSFEKFGGKHVFIPQINEEKLKKVEKLATIGALIVFAADAYILYHVMFLLIGETINVQEFKNEGGAAEIFGTLVSPKIITLSYLISPIGYLFFSLHFYYLLQNKKKKALKCFLLSLILVLSGLMTLSRSATVSYILLYAGVLFYSFPMMNKKFKRSISRILLIATVGIGLLLLIISQSRFSERYNIDSENSNTPLLDPSEQPLLTSFLDYYSQWEECSVVLMKNYSPDKLFYGLYNSCGLGVLIKQRIEGTEKTNTELGKKVEKYIGETAAAFHGPFARLLYDFGYTGTILFVILFIRVVNIISPKKNELSFNSLLFLPLFLPFALAFFSGNAFGSMTQNMGILFNLIIYLIIKNKKNKKLLEQYEFDN